MLCNLVNHVRNIVCLNEVPAMYDVLSLPARFHELRSMLKHGAPMPMMVSEKDNEITDTQTQTARHKGIIIDIDKDKPLAVGSKINVPYLFQMDKILAQGCKGFAVIRNPVYAIASWNQHSRNINEAHVLDHDFEKWPRYKDFEFETEERFTRQAELYNHFMQIMTRYGLMKFEYELFGEQHLLFISDVLGVEYKLKKPLPEIKNLNQDSRFQNIDLDAIRVAVKKYCPLVEGIYV